jgi:iron-sulfur cluster repair protein YtfE (RIC family)
MSAIDTTTRAQEPVASAAARHDRLAAELAQANELFYSVMRVHGPVHPELHALVPVIARLRDAVARRLDDAPEADPAAIRESVTELRELTGGYDVNRAVCRTHRRLLETLAALERDLNRSVRDTDPRR